jgi:hypothetical protein
MHINTTPPTQPGADGADASTAQQARRPITGPDRDATVQTAAVTTPEQPPRILATFRCRGALALVRVS